MAVAQEKDGLGPASVRRDEFLARVPRWYRGEVHFALTNVFCVAILWLALRGVSRTTWWELATVPVAFLYANYFEYILHKGPLHHRTRFSILYDRHTRQHHASFHHDSMAIRDMRELRMVLFPLPALFAAALLDLPLLVIVGHVVSPNAGRLFFGVAFGYYLLYEWCHLAYHMPESSWMGGNPVTRWLRTTHARHPDPRRMLRGNFNVTFPIFDAIMGTLER